MRRWPRLACCRSPVRASTAERAFALPAPCAALGPSPPARRSRACTGPRAPLCSRPCASASASHRLRVPYAAARRPNGAGRAVEGRDMCRSALLDPSRTRLDSFRPRSRPLLCASRVSPRLNAVEVLTEITWNHDEPPISHHYHRNSQLFSSEIYETGRKRRVSYVSDKVLQT